MNTELNITTAQTDEQLQGILLLQKQNLVSGLNDSEKKAEGFVTLEHNLDLLRVMAAHSPQFIALHQGKVVAYALTLAPELRTQFPLLEPMYRELQKLKYRDKLIPPERFMAAGQTCIAKEYRGTGLLPRLYQTMQQHLQNNYEGCISEIAERNTRSVHAHEKAGFRSIHAYHDGEQVWHIVLLDWTDKNNRL